MRRGDRPPSQAFQSAFIHFGSLQVECDFCGRTHFANNPEAGDWEPGELEHLREAEQQNPGMVMGWDCDSIGSGEVFGKTFAECCPCRGIWHYEKWIWRHRHEIANYIAARVQREARQARAEAEELILAKSLMDQDWAVTRVQDVLKNVRDGGCVDEPVGMAAEGKMEWCEEKTHGWRYSADDVRWVHVDHREGAA